MQYTSCLHDLHISSGVILIPLPVIHSFVLTRTIYLYFPENSGCEFQKCLL
nr:MAG TPA: hypothetical protein [Caudoviricetes sp.]